MVTHGTETNVTSLIYNEVLYKIDNGTETNVTSLIYNEVLYKIDK
jgi:hypothetical protein